MIKLMNIETERLDEFFKIIDNCKGKVELVSDEGDRINMKSKLCQYISIANIFTAGSDVISHLNLEAENTEDVAELLKFMLGRR